MLKLKNHFRLVLFVYIHLLTHMLLFSSHRSLLKIIVFLPHLIFLFIFEKTCVQWHFSLIKIGEQNPTFNAVMFYVFVAQVHMGNPSFVRFRLPSDEYPPRSCPTYFLKVRRLFLWRNFCTDRVKSVMNMHDTKHLQYYLGSVTDWQDRGVEIFSSLRCALNLISTFLFVI